MHKYYIYKLKNINLQDRINKFPPEFKFNIDFAYLVMHFLLEQMANKIVGKEIQDLYEVYNPLDSKILQKYEHDYRNHIRYLGENFPSVGNILERINYSENKCYSYRFRPFYKYIQLEPYLLEDKVIIKKLLKDKTKTLSPEVKKFCPFLVNYFDDTRLTINLVEALNLNADQLEEEGNVKKYLLNAFKILKIQNGQYYMSFNPETDGRFHSNITGFPKGFRKFLRYDGKKLAEIDISASVPTFLYYILTNYELSTKHLEFIISKHKSYYNHYMLVKNTQGVDNKEISSFGSAVLNGVLYESFKPKLVEYYAADETFQQWQWNEYNFPQHSYLNYHKKPRNKMITEKDSKNAMLSLFNSKNGSFDLEEVAFKSIYPTIFEFLKIFKKANHKYFSHLLLQTESYFMLNIIARRLNNKFRKKIPFFTLHDCIVVPESQLNAVCNFMKEIFLVELGFIPTIKAEVWN